MVPITRAIGMTDYGGAGSHHSRIAMIQVTDWDMGYRTCHSAKNMARDSAR